MITEINESKTLKSIHHANDLHLMEENGNHINVGKVVNVDVSVKNFMYVKKIILGILLNVVVKVENI